MFIERMMVLIVRDVDWMERDGERWSGRRINIQIQFLLKPMDLNVASRLWDLPETLRYARLPARNRCLVSMMSMCAIWRGLVDQWADVLTTQMSLSLLQCETSNKMEKLWICRDLIICLRVWLTSSRAVYFCPWDKIFKRDDRYVAQMFLKIKML